MNNTHDTLKEHARRVEQEITALRKMLDARRRERTPKSVLRPAGCAGAKGGAMNEQESGHADNSLDRMFDLYESRISQLESKLQMSQAGLAVKDAEIAALRERLKTYQRAVLWCYGWINRAFAWGLSLEEFANSIEDDRWNEVGALVGEAADEVDP